MTPLPTSTTDRRTRPHRRRTEMLLVLVALLTVGADCVGPIGDSAGGPHLINNSGHDIRIVLVEEDGDERFLNELSAGEDTYLGQAGCHDRAVVVRTRPAGVELDRREPGTMCDEGQEWIVGPPEPSATGT